ncbi:hypothetical protein Tco_0771472 [Tanacetum coccineum]|uniref:Uncharacterized protein n=1 Tax=Tanacetum coccineum TaxID=301880 RepID=A0ABQ4ZGH1_9ASTR
MKGQDNPLIPNLHPHLLNSTIKKPIIVPSSYQPKKTQKPRTAIRATEISQSSGCINLVEDETVYMEWEDRIERAATTAFSLDAKQDNGNINRTQSMATLNESFPQGTDLGSGPRFGEQKEKRDVNPNQASLHQMANLDFCDTHNMVAFLNKSEGSKGFHHIVDFLNTSHIKFALTKNPTIYTSLIQQFWQTASTSTLEDGEVEITTTIDGQLKTITEASLRRHIKFEDAYGISSLPNTEIFEQLAVMGYASDSNKLTFQKGHFSLQWRFLIHTNLHCLSPKKTAWEQFSSNIVSAIICLATNRTFNFSKMIFEGMVKNLDSRYLKGRPNLGLWYPKDSPFILEDFSDSDYAGASLDRKSTTGGCQFLGSRLISWQCKMQTVVANSTTKAEYIAASHCCGQVLWIQN